MGEGKSIGEKAVLYDRSNHNLLKWVSPPMNGVLRNQLSQVHSFPGGTPVVWEETKVTHKLAQTHS